MQIHHVHAQKRKEKGTRRAYLTGKEKTEEGRDGEEEDEMEDVQREEKRLEKGGGGGQGCKGGYGQGEKEGGW